MDPTYLPTSEYARAMQTLRAGKSVFWWLILLSILVQVAAFVAVNFVGVLDATHQRAQAEPATAPAVLPAADQAPAAAENPAEQETHQAAEIEVLMPRPDRRAQIWEFSLHWSLAATKFLAFICALILVILGTYHVQLSLVGRLGGAAGFTRALMWALVLLALLTPWQQVFDRSFVSGALYNLTDLESQTRDIRWGVGLEAPTLWQQIIYYTRFLAFPIVAGLVALVVHSRLRQGYRSMVMIEPT